jgi:hypothetical protein
MRRLFTFLLLLGMLNVTAYAQDTVVFSGARCSYTKIHKFNDFQVFARLGFAWGAIKVNYGLTDFLKNDYVRPPKLFVGCELLIPGEF